MNSSVIRATCPRLSVVPLPYSLSPWRKEGEKGEEEGGGEEGGEGEEEGEGEEGGGGREEGGGGVRAGGTRLLERRRGVHGKCFQLHVNFILQVPNPCTTLRTRLREGVL